MREENSTARGFLILSMAGMAAKVLSVIYMPLLIAIIGRGGYAIYNNAYSVFIFFYAITSTGMQPAVAKVVTELEAMGNPRDAIRAFKLSRNLLALVGIFLAIILAVFGFPIAELVLNNVNAGYGVIALAPCIFFTCILSAYKGYFQGKGEMKGIAISTVVEQLLNIVFSLAFAYILVHVSLPLGSAGGTIGTTIGAFVAILCLIYIYDKKNFEEESIKITGQKRKVSNKKIMSKVIKYAIPITVSAGIQNLGSIIDVGNVNSRLESAGFVYDQYMELVGSLGQYIQLLGVPLIIISSLATTVLPAVSRAMALKDKKEIKKSISYGFRMTLLITIPAAIGLSMVSKEVYTVLFGSDYGSYLMQWGAFIVILMGITQIQNVVLQGINKQVFVMNSFIVGITLKIITNYILVGIKDINIMGAVWGNLVLYLIPAVLNYGAINRTLKVKISLIKMSVKPLIAGGFMALSIYILKEAFSILIRFTGINRLGYIAVLMVLVSVGAFVYFYVIVAIAGIRKRDIDSFSPRIYGYLPRFIRKELK